MNPGHPQGGPIKRKKIRTPKYSYSGLDGVPGLAAGTSRGYGHQPQTAAPVDPFPPLWNKLDGAIRAIYGHNAVSLSFEELYRTAYHLVSRQCGTRLYTAVKGALAAQLDRMVLAFLVPLPPYTGEEAPAEELIQWLEVLVNLWKEHTVCLRMIQDVLMYLDRHHIPKSSPAAHVDGDGEALMGLWPLGIQMFLRHVLRSPHLPVLVRTVDVLLELIRRDREQGTSQPSTHQSLLAQVTDMLLSLPSPGPSSGSSTGSTTYHNDFEPAHLAATQTYYQVMSEKALATSTAGEYLKQTEQWLTMEDIKGATWIRESTRQSTLDRVRDACLGGDMGQRVIAMSGSGLAELLDLKGYQDLERMYRLLQRVERGHERMRQALKNRLISLGKDINAAVLTTSKGRRSSSAQPAPSSTPSPMVMGAAESVQWVVRLRELKDRVDTCILRSFGQGDVTFKDAVNEAFVTIVNDFPTAPESLSAYVDDYLKRGGKRSRRTDKEGSDALGGGDEEETEVFLDGVIGIFRFIREKDIFEAHYKTHLSRRLLHPHHHRSLSEDTERAMLAKFKVDCGHHFTQKMEGMLNDVQVSEELMRSWRKECGIDTGMDMTVQVLTRTCWPFPAPSTRRDSNQEEGSGPVGVIWPEVLMKARSAFEGFYASRHTGRRLTWQEGQGAAEIRALFPPKPSEAGKPRRYDLMVSTLCMLVLLCFNSSPSSSATNDLLQLTGLAEEDLKRTLQSLACGKYRVLQKSPKGKEVEMDDEFRINTSFTAPTVRVRIQQVMAPKISASIAEARETRKEVVESRRVQMDAAIVRLMKARQRMSHTDLVLELTQALASRFLVDPQEVKRRVEVLIERDFLERSPNDQRVYQYVA
ncbi:Cullin [Piptocephalis cylindrospora]|uniref:Cullin n=1 Tax=Piptocephalis cylindrospora TaxID=1907219 RepID=A0A4P9Y2W1_9FUNG|nr:Cullin [Piptocephalis cylindrospora]|eukprot:RKP12942.1 Cullin [Piptocephalis cylindrospora]